MARAKPYEFLEHTADIAVNVHGRDGAQLFEHAAAALFAVIARKRAGAVKRPVSLNVTVSGGSREELFINWLNELLSLSAVKELIFSGFRVRFLNDHQLKARVSGRPFSSCTVTTEVKAATYHELAITAGKRGWQARVIFDV